MSPIGWGVLVVDATDVRWADRPFPHSIGHASESELAAPNPRCFDWTDKVIARLEFRSDAGRNWEGVWSGSAPSLSFQILGSSP